MTYKLYDPTHFFLKETTRRKTLFSPRPSHGPALWKSGKISPSRSALFHTATSTLVPLLH